ncbi:plasmid mobilization protein [Reichenbachiella sp.]|uniref:plasmid mobilization protein n=1 Tax=Reichenbachiella sp. TaxID=2184521 RepID=UPI003B5C168A
MARPEKLIKKQKRVTVRYTLAEYLFVQQYAEERGLSISEYIRSRSLDERPSLKKTPEQIAAYMELVALSNKLNQAGEMFEIDCIDGILNRLDDVINQF